MKKSLKMAIASSDGKVINQHFGKARKFIIIESDGEGSKSSKLGRTIPHAALSSTEVMQTMRLKKVFLLSATAMRCFAAGSEEAQQKDCRA